MEGKVFLGEKGLEFRFENREVLSRRNGRKVRVFKFRYSELPLVVNICLDLFCWGVGGEVELYNR